MALFISRKSILKLEVPFRSTLAKNQLLSIALCPRSWKGSRNHSFLPVLSGMGSTLILGSNGLVYQNTKENEQKHSLVFLAGAY